MKGVIKKLEVCEYSNTGELYLQKIFHTNEDEKYNIRFLIEDVSIIPEQFLWKGVCVDVYGGFEVVKKGEEETKSGFTAKIVYLKVINLDKIEINT